MTRKTGFISDDLAATVVPTAPADLVVGGPCQVGGVPAVVAEAADEDGAVVARFRGVFRMPVADTGGVAPGDKIWFNATDNSLSKTGAGAIQFGYAMESIADGAGVTDILVLLRGGSLTSLSLSVPTGLVASASSATEISVEWDTINAANFGGITILYDVRYKVTTESTWLTPDATSDIATFSVTISGLTASTSYDIQVRAHSGEIVSGWTTTTTVTTPA